MKLEDRLTSRDATLYVPGIQALVRLPLEQMRRDREAGLRTGGFVTGYPGSPLSGYDLALEKAADELDRHGVLHRPGVNEESAATAIWGTQMIDDHEDRTVDGVVAYWYGKGPGVDRSGDAIKHGNFAGTSRHGAVVLLDGVDHEAKSSTMPYQDDYAFVSAGVPILYPSSVSEFLTLGIHAAELSRFSGAWSSLKLHTALCDGGETVDLGAMPDIVTPQLTIDGVPFVKRTDFRFFPGLNIQHERHQHLERSEAILAYARANHLNRVVAGDAGRARLGIVTAGKTWADLRQALAMLGLDEAALEKLGIAVLKMGLVWPVEPEVVRTFADGLEEVVVVEEKRGFLEDQVRQVLSGVSTVSVIGKRDRDGRPLFPSHGAMDADIVADRLVRALSPHVDTEGLRPVVERIDVIASREYDDHLTRTPNYCSGCPHNTSTQLLDDQVAWGSPGCHSFASIMDQPHRHIEAMTQLGGEGLPWIGLSPFVETSHMVQNVGDGSLFHSSYANIRACMEAGADITFKVLFNGYIANTGAQESPNGRTVAELTRLLAADRIPAVVVLTKDPAQYRDQALGATTQVRRNTEIDDVSRELRDRGGVSVIIYDESCANERQRQQRRGKAPRPERYVMINPAVCEHCGDCGEITNCMSLEATETEFGTKTRVNPSTCAQDEFCIQGDCPSFVTVRTAPETGYRRPEMPEVSLDMLPAAMTHPLKGDFNVYVPGVGGTGVITVNAILATAAGMDNLGVRTYDQTGAAQKWGSVVSSVVLAEGEPTSYRIGVGAADLYLGLDLVSAAASTHLRHCDPDRTTAVVNSGVFPTGEMTRDVDVTPDVAGMIDSIGRWTRADDMVHLDARYVAETILGNHMLANIVMLGAAAQKGLLPVSTTSIEDAIELNGVKVQANLTAFRLGRLFVADLDQFRALTQPRPLTLDEKAAREEQALPPAHRPRYRRLLEWARLGGRDLEELAVSRAADLIRYQGPALALDWVKDAVRVAEVEHERTRVEDGRTGPVALAYATNLHRLLAYKDEYEVARLHLQAAFGDEVDRTFEDVRSLRFHLAPPTLRRLGMKKSKIAVPGVVAVPMFQTLRALRHLRGGPLDVFGRTAHRRLEAELPDWYRSVMDQALEHLDDQRRDMVVDVARTPEGIRGYEDLKERRIAEARQSADERLAALTRPRLPLVM